jgi:hypothetical protein
MIKLVNGRGQLGKALSKELEQTNYTLFREPGYGDSEDVSIYHTWNVKDKSESTQSFELKKFIKFVDKSSSDQKIIFISTSSQKESWYVHYKQVAEAYLLTNHSNSLILRFPLFIGKGPVLGFKNKTMVPYGKMELISVGDAAHEVVQKIYYNGNVRCFTFRGEVVNAQTIYKVLSV